jgi:phage shock protein C
MAAEFYGLATQTVLPMLRAMFDENDPMSKPLMRVRQGALIAGVCGGIAKWFGWDPTIVRVVYVMLTLLSAAFPGVILYILLWILMPLEPE